MEVLETINEVFSRNLEKFRGNRTQKDIAKALGMSLKAYNRLENGTLPRSSLFPKLARILGVPETTLFLDPDLSSPTAEQIAEVLSFALQNDSFRADFAGLIRSYMSVLGSKK